MAVKNKKDDVNNEYLTCTGSLMSFGAMLSKDLETPSTMRLGHSKGLQRTSSGKQRAHTAAPNKAAEP
jgi:hypothetical protein